MGLAQDLRDYYRKTYIQFEIVKATAGREMALLPNKHELEGMKKGIAVRNIKAYSLAYLNSNFEAFDFYDKNYNVYTSVATLKNFPTFSYAVTQRQKQQEQFLDAFNKEPENYIAGYDIFLDIDSKKFQEGKEQAQKTIDFFAEYNLPLTINPSGGKDGGFHINIPFEAFNGAIPPTQMTKLGKEIGIDLVEEGISDLDMGLWDIRRVKKCPYSLVYNGTDLNVVLPLTEKQFSDLTEETCKLKNVTKEIPLKERGLCPWDFGKPKIKEFLQDYKYIERLTK